MSRVFAIAALTGVLTTGPLQAQKYDGYWESSGEQTGPSFIVLATDVSSSMNEGDPLIPDSEGVLQAMRDDAQVTFLQLLPFVHPRSYVGVVQFAYKVRYCRPGDAQRAVRPGEPALLPWHATELDRDTVRALVRSIVPEPDLRTRVEVAMDWAHQRIAMARERHGDGPAMLILLTDGDPTNAQYELSGVSRRVEDATNRLRADDVRVYPIIINRASWRPTRPPSALSDKEKAAERLMERVARATGGKTYRITRNFQLLDIFSEVLGAGVREPTVRFTVSRHHRTAILIGTALTSIEITGAGGGSGGKAYSLPIVGGIDAESGIGRKIIPLTKWDIMIVRRPADLSRLDRYWCGEWRLVPDSSEGDSKWRVYLIPDMLLRIAGKPVSPWWAFEQVQVRAELVERPKELGEGDRAIPPLKGKDLLLSFEVAPVGVEEGIRLLERGRWDSAGRVYTTDPFYLADTVAKPGRYRVICDCVDNVGGFGILLGRFAEVFEVQPVPLSLQLRKVWDGSVVLEVPAGTSQAAASCQGGDQIYGEIVPCVQEQADRFTGTLHLDDFTPREWPFSLDISGRLVTNAFTLPLGATHLAGWAEVKVETPAGARDIRLPAFDLPFAPAPPRLERQFGDRRRALWVGEVHEQTLTLSILPVFEESAERIKASFPMEFSRVSMRVTDTPSGVSKWVPVRCRRESAPRYLIERKAPKVVGSYRLESDAPIPPSDRCEIELGAVIAGLKAEPEEYDVVDPVREEVFIWRVFQDPASRLIPGVGGVLYRGEPVRFAAEWDADHEVSAVRFEIERRGADPMTVDLSPSAGERAAQVDELIDELPVGETYPVYVNVAFGADGADSGMNLRLYGGEFRAEDRELELTGLSVGETPGTDIECRALEEMTLPLRAGFAGYVPENPRHSQQIEGFKKSCTVKVSTEGGPTEDCSDAVQWTGVHPPPPYEGLRGVYRFEGQVTYTPQRTGRSTVEFGGELRAGEGMGSVNRLFVRDPQLFLEVRRINHSGERLLFDTGKLVAGEEAVFPARTTLATQLGVRIQRGGDGSAEPWPVRVEVIRRSSPDEGETVESHEEVELTTDSPRADWRFPVKLPGRYSVRLYSAGSRPGQPHVDRLTPDLLTIKRIEPEAMLTPSSRLTRAVRQWPFKYRVPIQPDWSFPWRALDFEFHLPGDEWRRGIAHREPSYKDGTMWLVVESPAYLPSLEASSLVDGPVEFRLRYRQAELIRWEHQDVGVVEPSLTAWFKVQRPRGGVEESEAGSRELMAPVSLQARPKFRLASELVTHWAIDGVRAYVWRNPGGDLARGEATPEALAELVKRRKEQQADRGESAPAGGKGDAIRRVEDDGILEVFDFDVDNPNWQTIIKADAPIPWGRPQFGREDKYAVLFSATYDPRCPAYSAGADISERSDGALITEWSGVYCETVDVSFWRAMPLMYWGIMGIVVWWAVVWPLKLAVPSPENLGLDVRMTSANAAVSPCKYGNASLADVREPSWRGEWSLYHEYLRHNWVWSQAAEVVTSGLFAWANFWIIGGLLNALSSPRKLAPAVVASVVVLMRRGFLARRRAWISVRATLGAGATNVKMGLVCVTRGLSTKAGRILCPQAGWEELPGEGTTKSLTVNLAFQTEGGQGSIPVTLSVSRPRRPERATAGHPGASKTEPDDD